MWIFLPAIPLWLVSLWLFLTGLWFQNRAVVMYDMQKKRAAHTKGQPASTSSLSADERHDYEGRLDQLQAWLDQAREDLDEAKGELTNLRSENTRLADLLRRSAAGNVVDIKDVS